MINKAKEFAIKHHGEQKYGDRPYSFHLDQVVSYLVPLWRNCSSNRLSSRRCRRHGRATLEQVELEFGATVASCVGVLTDEPGLQIGKNAKQRPTKKWQR